MAMSILKKIWPEWTLGKRIGSGSYGVVYEAVRSEYGVENHAAIKVILIPANEAEVDSLRSEGLDMNATKTHFENIVQDFVNEIRVMVSLDGRPNIVNVKDYKVVEKEGEFGWHIFILMELLTPFAVYTCGKTLTEKEIIKLGCDICTALETCEQENIIHRDIKPGNILVHSKSGEFKLGDFGIARKFEWMTGGLSQRCTPKYMAPEVATRTDYDSRVDIYSLGIVLYQLLNGMRIPFQEKKQINSLMDIDNAVKRRNNGERLLAPSDASPAMANVILRACAFDPDMRFASATEMKKALMDVANGTYRPVAIGNPDKTTSVRKAARNPEQTVSVRKAPAASMEKFGQTVDTFGTTSKKSKLSKVIVAAVVAVALVVGGIFAASYFSTQKKIEAILDDAEIFASDEKYADAVVKIEEGLAEYSDSEKLQDKLTEYQNALTDQKIATVLADAGALAAEEKYKDARNVIQDGLQDYPDSLALHDKLAEYGDAYENQQITAIIAEAEALAAADEYEDALGEVNKGLVQYPASEALKEKAETYTTSLKAQVKEKTLTEAAALAEAGDYVAAMELIENAQKTQGDDGEYQKAYTTYNDAYMNEIRNEAFTKADKLASSGDYLGAVNTIKDATTAFGQDNQLLEKEKYYEDLFAEAEIAKANNLMETSGYDDAMNSINAAFGKFPQNVALLEAKNEIASHKPISLLSMHVVEEKYYETGVFADTYGNTYATGFMVGSYHGWSGKAVFNLNRKYNKLTFVLAPADTGDGEECQIKISADDKVLHVATLLPTTEPQKLTFDINECSLLKFERLDGAGMWGDDVIIGDPYVQK